MTSARWSKAVLFLLPALLVGLPLYGCETTDELVDPGFEDGVVIIDPSPDTIQAPWTMVTPTGEEIQGAGDFTLKQQVAGEYVLSWGAVEGYGTPQQASGILDAGGSLRFADSYVARPSPTGAIAIDADPDELQAGWLLSRNDKQVEDGNGDTLLTEMDTGDYRLTWLDVDGWNSPVPNDQTLAVVVDDTVSITGTYTQIVGEPTGNIVVNPTPAELDARWALSGPDGFATAGSGWKQMLDRPTGRYRVIWEHIPGYRTPDAITSTLEDGATIEFDVSYEATTGTVTLDPGPDSIDAPWVLEYEAGSSQSGSGDTTLRDLPTGEYTVRWGAVDGWIEPSPRLIQLAEDDAQVIAGEYQPEPTATGDVAIVADPESASWALVGPEFSTTGTGSRTFTGVATGDYTITWQSLNGWVTPNPSSETRTLEADRTLSLVGSYGNPEAPQVDPTPTELQDGQLVTVTGENFGSRQADVEWLGGLDGRIENMALNTEADGFGSRWQVGVSSSATPAHVSSERSHSGNKAIKSWVSNTVANSWQSGYMYTPGQEFDEIYASWWTYFDPISQSNCTSGYGPQWKMWRLNATSNFSDSFSNFLGEIMSSGNYNIDTGRRSNLYTMIWSAEDEAWDCSQPGLCWPAGYPNGTYGEHIHNDVPYPNDARRWVRWEVYVKASSAVDRRDGTYIYRCYLPGENTWAVEWEENIITHQNVGSTPGVSTWLNWTRFIWQNFWGNCGGNAEWFIDDIYVQTGSGSRARVELGDAPTWDACTRKEVQNATSWGPGSISFETNRGAFSSGETAYLYVVRADGSVSNARPITIR